MAASADQEAVEAWRSIPGLIHGLVDGLADEELDHRAGDSSMTIREVVHHVVEANAVAASIVIAALGSPGCIYDWSWMMPFGPWMERMGYDRKPLGPALRMLDALNEYVAAQIEPLADGLGRVVQLRDERAAKPRPVTIAEVLRQEAEHAWEHVGGNSRPPKPTGA